ncbi:hypothetical protein CBM2634_U150004 [Cupriavidus taiwanensis]|uniref:Uncharacterized protein n=1 Tax=Cupriavidus taiwanensis TaxID=164546 RepID=A0A375JCM1_9BURK|nr:hypothetical protein CBM2634_U150004 [Cupriavidus taiwanensis]
MRPAATGGRARCRRVPRADLALLFPARATQYIEGAAAGCSEVDVTAQPAPPSGDSFSCVSGHHTARGCCGRRVIA